MQFIFGHLLRKQSHRARTCTRMFGSFEKPRGLHTAAEQDFSFTLDLFSGIPRESWIAWGVERIALHCIASHNMIDEARKTLKRARNVSMNLATQWSSSLGCGTRRTAIQSSDRFNLSLSKYKAS